MKERIAAFQHSSPTGSLNHTEYRPLRDFPIGISIEIKRIGEAVVGGELQLGIWLRAHWKFLATALHTDADDLVQQLPFIPALLVHGHHWYLVVSTLQKDRMVLYTNIRIGHTQHALGVFELVYSLRVLAEWMEEKYWPWFAEALLGVRSNSG